jgi:hypothetical protein
MAGTAKARWSRRRFVTTGIATTAVVAGAALSVENAFFSGPNAPARLSTPSEQWPISVSVLPTTLHSGDLIIVDQRNQSILQVRGSTSTVIATIETWSKSLLFGAVGSAKTNTLWVSADGMVLPDGTVYYGLRGISRIIQVNLATGRAERVFAAPNLVDPTGLLLDESTGVLYIADFNSFGNSGRVSRLDLSSGDVVVISEGKHLATPVGINWAGPDKVVVGSGLMPEVNNGASGGRIVEVDLRTGEQTLVHQHVTHHGVVIGAVKLPGGTFMATRSDWPDQARTAVFATTGGDGFQLLFQPQPGFLGSGMAPTATGAWVTESTQRQLLHITPTGEVTAKVDLPGLREFKLANADQTLESVSLVG